jgi:hypothetical protein
MYAKDGTITSSPGAISQRMEAISRASVQEVERRAFLKPNLCSKNLWQSLVYLPFPAIVPARAPRAIWITEAMGK